MKQEIISLNSDTVNRAGFRFALTGLEKSIKDSFNTGIPMCIGHDLHKIYGWIVPYGLYFEPKITRVLGKKIIATNDEEFKEILRAHQNFLNRRYYEDFIPHQEKFLGLIGKHLTAKHSRVYIGTAAVYEKGIMDKILPEILSYKDDDGIIPLNIILENFTYLGQGIFKQKGSDLAIFAHSFFRRSQSIHNNFHFYFLDELISLKNDKDILIKLRIDENLIGFAPSYHNTMELEHHWGPKFSDNISAIKKGLSKFECDDFQRGYYGISRTEFYWKKDGNEMTFELEELRNDSSPMEKEDTYHCRYMHSIFNNTTKKFTHFDGAIRSYNLEEMLERLDKNFLEYGRKARYTKLFRIDGKLSLAKWQLLITHYMQGNPLIYEYLGLGEERELQRLQPRKLDKEKQLLPFSIDANDGVRLFVTYNAIPENLKNGRYIDVFDIIASDQDTLNCVEHLIFEIKKSLQKIGQDLEIPEKVTLLKIDDRYWNIPSIIHVGANANDLLAATVTAYCNLFEAMHKKGFDSDISLTLGLIIDNRLVRVSSYGNIKSQVNWLKENMPFPHDGEDFSKWIVKQKKYLDEFPEKSDDPLISSLVQSDGVLYIKRVAVKYDFSFFEDEVGLKYEIKMPKEDDEIYDLIKTQKVMPKLLSIVKEAVWSDNGENYFTSTRSKWLDESEAHINITKWEPLSLYWSKS